MSKARGFSWYFVDDKDSVLNGRYEDNCLPVSLDPLAWRKIARLNASPLHRLSIEGMGLFLDVLALRKNEALLNAIKQWGLAESLIQEKTIWQAWVEGADGRWYPSQHPTEDDAIAEQAYHADDAPDAVGWRDMPSVRPMTLCVGTQKLGGCRCETGVE